MGLTENLNILSRSFPDIFEKIRNAGAMGNNNAVRLENARNGMLTIIYENDPGSTYIHSKYDPAAEAQRFIGQYKDVGRYKHVFFYGVGMGYHIEEFCRNWPDRKFTLYEPEQSILLSYLKERQLEKLPLSNCKGIYTGSSQRDIGYMLQQYVSQINGEVLFVILPSYERIFSEKYKYFLEAFRIAVMNKRASLQAQTHFQKLWTTNSIKNFKEVVNSSNILQDKKGYFVGKPAIIAAAGPSLEDELENLRLIKEKGLAYIFSVGSAINTLISDGILPDAVCIYDPAPNTNEVIRKVKEQRLDIPLIYGSSVYSGAIQDYPGRKLHMLTSQDTISSFFLKHKNEKELAGIIDSPSIAIVALQMFIMLGCAPIILVGQNFAFKNNRYYAQGIEYENRSGELSSSDMDNALEERDVNGGRVQTSKLFNHMRNQMEMYIDRCGCKDIVNATKGGAKIKGTVYKPLEELIEKELVHSSIDSLWFEDSDSPYDIGCLISQGKLMSKEKEESETLITELIDTMSMLKSEHNAKLLQKALNRFEQAYNKLVINYYFNNVLKPMNRVQLEMISKNLADVSEVKDVMGKARFINETFSDVFECCYKDMNSIDYDFYNMIEEILENDIKVMTFSIKAC